MAYIFGDGFDNYPTWATGSQISCGGWTAISGGGVSTTGSNTRFSYGKALNPNGQYLWKKFDSPSSNTLYFSLTYWHNDTISLLNNAGYYVYVTLNEGSSAQITVTFKGNGSIEFLRGGINGTVIASFADAFVNLNWNHWQFKVVIDSVAGAVYVRKDGDTNNTHFMENINTQNTANAWADSVFLGNVRGYLFGVPELCDDFILFDNSGAAPNDWLGDVRAFTLFPTANDTVQFQPLSDTNYMMVDEQNMDDDGTYNYSDVVGATDMFDVDNLPVAPTAIHVVNVKVAAKKDNTQTRTASAIIDSGGTVDFSPEVRLPASYVGLVKSYPVDPNTGSSWTITAVNSVKIGYKIIS